MKAILRSQINITDSKQLKKKKKIKSCERLHHYTGFPSSSITGATLWPSSSMTS